MKVLLLGANGQLGWELKRTCPQDIILTTCDYPKVDFLSTTSITTCIETARPDWIINAAAYTAVDKAEEEKETAERINHTAVREIAGLCRQNNIRLIQISTDFVFNGKAHRPYLPQDTPDPISTYGKTKLKGEQAALEILKDDAAIIRTAWLYSSHGANFVKSMLNFFETKPELNIIDEQIGTPTWANGLAQAVWQAIDKNLTGIHHFTDAGIASWYDFATAIQEEALSLNLTQKEIPINPIPASQYPTPAERPFYSVLDKTSLWQTLDLKPVHWRKQLRSMLKELK
ncbi:dTDP-4-dehydrorhamnose reductase [uncultured Desulfobacter sp.]|uniref:dTDP-4-dehydrorhamnose reductase n=1 Tax=uncultured Desulfobacter sp. TaxID=240139 RepID=UPI0029C6F429|nr:dTDP-4-dehydrorhamnose reductase [uncultured Desulfobacter sp.]